MEDLVRIIAVIGPTAGGKTDIGITLAQETDGEVISVDSMQIYRWMDIGTAKPSPELLAKVPHHLIDILNPDQEYNAGKFANAADTIIDQLVQRGKTPILVGGTGLYLRALINGMIAVPGISSKIRNEVRTLAAEKRVGECYLKLSELDPKSAAKLHPNDILRITRALEVVLETGHSIQEYQASHRFKQDRYNVFYVGTTWPREVLYDRINRRVKQMIDQGLVHETQSILERGYSEHLPALNSIGYKQAVAFLHNRLSQDEMIADIQQKSRHYAKKQVTWYKKDRSIHWLEGNNLNSEDMNAIKQHLARKF